MRFINYIKKNKRNIYFNINLIFLMFGFFGIIGGLWIFWTGLHNIDLSSNFLRVSIILEEHNITLKDHTLNDKFVTLEELYIIGVKQLFAGIFLLLISNLFFMSSLNELIITHPDYGRAN